MLRGRTSGGVPGHTGAFDPQGPHLSKPLPATHAHPSTIGTQGGRQRRTPRRGPWLPGSLLCLQSWAPIPAPVPLCPLAVGGGSAEHGLCPGRGSDSSRVGPRAVGPGVRDARTCWPSVRSAGWLAAKGGGRRAEGSGAHALCAEPATLRAACSLHGWSSPCCADSVTLINAQLPDA